MADELKPGGLDTWGAITAVHGMVERDKALEEAAKICEERSAKLLTCTQQLTRNVTRATFLAIAAEAGECARAIRALKTKEKADE